MSTSGLSTGLTGREWSWEGEGRLLPPTASVLHASAPRGQQLLSSWLLGDTGLDPGPLPPASHPWSVQKTPCFLHTSDCLASTGSAGTESYALCSLAMLAHLAFLPPASLTAFPGGQAGQGAPACLPLTSHRASRLRLPKPHSGVLPALDPGQSRDGAGSLTPVYPLSLALGKTFLGHLGIANGQANGV